MKKGIYKYRTDTRRQKRELYKLESRHARELKDKQMNLIIRLILFFKYLITFRVQDAKDALDMEKELSPKEESLIRDAMERYIHAYNGTPYVRKEPKIGRNETCPCGSGKKYKKCCGR